MWCESITHKLHNPKMSESHCNLNNPFIPLWGVKLNMPTKHAKQTRQDFLKFAGKTWTWQRWPDNKHAKQSMAQEIKRCKQGLNMTGVTRKEACQIINRSSKHANEHVCAKEDLEMLAVIFARTVPVANTRSCQPQQGNMMLKYYP